jgi:hypothetical protein
MSTFNYADVSEMSLSELYSFANDKYWGGALPDIDLEWSDQMRAKLGVAIPDHLRDQGRHAIRLSDRLRNDPKKILNVIVHEQIHIWQFEQFNRTKDGVYLDRKNIARSLGHRKGHGIIFHSQADRLQHDFPEITISVADDFDAEMSGVEKSPRYGAVLSVRDRSGVRHQALFWAEHDFHDRLSILSEQLIEVYGASLVERVTPFTTQNMNVERFVRVNKIGSLRKGQAKVIFKNDYVQDILSDDDTTVHWDQSIDLKAHAPDVDPRISDLIPAIKAYRGDPFPHYVAMAINNAKGLVSKRLDVEAAEKAIVGRHPEIDEKTISFLESEWRKAQPVDLFRKGRMLNVFVDQTTRERRRKTLDLGAFGRNSVDFWRDIGGDSRIDWDTYRHKMINEIDKAYKKQAKNSMRDPEEVLIERSMMVDQLIQAPEMINASAAIADAHYRHAQLPLDSFVCRSLAHMRTLGFDANERDGKVREVESAWHSSDLATSLSETLAGRATVRDIIETYKDIVQDQPIRNLGIRMTTVSSFIESFKDRVTPLTTEDAFDRIKQVIKDVIIDTDPLSGQRDVDSALNTVEQEWHKHLHNEKRLTSELATRSTYSL